MALSNLSDAEKAILPENLWYLLEKLSMPGQKEDTGGGAGIGGGFSLPSLNLPSLNLGFQGPSVGLPQPTAKLPQPTLPGFQLPKAELPSLPSIGAPELDLGKLGLPSMKLPELNLPQLNIPGLPEEVRKMLEIAYPGFKQDESGKVIFNPDTGETIEITKALGKLSGQDWLSKLGSTAGDISKWITKPIESGLGAVGLGGLTSLIGPASLMYGGASAIAELLNATGYNKQRAEWEESENEKWNKINTTAVKNYMYEDSKNGEYYRLGANLMTAANPGVQNMPRYAPSGWVQVNSIGNAQSYYRPIEKYDPTSGKWVDVSNSLTDKYKTFTLENFTSGKMFA